MAPKWYKKASVQAAIVTGIFAIVSAIIVGTFSIYRSKQGPATNPPQPRSGQLTDETGDKKPGTKNISSVIDTAVHPIADPLWDTLESLVSRDIDLNVRIKPEKPQYCIGDSIELVISSEKACYINILNLGTDQNTYLLFPNRYSPDNNMIEEKKLLVIPDQESYHFQIGGPAGKERIYILATSMDLNLLNEQPEEILKKLQAPFLVFTDTTQVTRTVQIIETVAQMQRTLCRVELSVIDQKVGQ